MDFLLPLSTISKSGLIILWILLVDEHTVIITTISVLLYAFQNNSKKAYKHDISLQLFKYTSKYQIIFKVLNNMYILLLG
jgi:hypothetical protein